MSVLYDGNKVIPGPIVTLNKNIQTAGGGQKLGVLYDISIDGTMMSFKGSPQGGSLNTVGFGGPYNAFWTITGYPPDESVIANSRLKSIEKKQAALRALFATDGKWLEWQPDDGTAPLKCQPRIKSITFEEDLWYHVCKYSIKAESDYLYLTGSPEVDTPYHNELINQADESWQVEDGEVVKTFRLSHTVNAVGKRIFDATGTETQPPWMNARDFVLNRLVLGYTGASTFSPLAGNALVNQSTVGSGSVINFSTLNPFNFSRNESINELGGSYSVTENWVLAATSGTDVYSVSVKRLSAEPYTNVDVLIQGTIKGFYHDLGDYDARNNSANYVWSQLQGVPLYNRVQSYATGTVLNVQPLAAALDYSPLDGTIGYSYAFSDRLVNGDVLEEFIVAKKFNMETYMVDVGIQGKVIGRKYEADTNPKAEFVRAQTFWNTLKVSPNIYNKIINSNFFPEVTGVLRQYPSSADVDMDESQGIISYNYTFNTRKNDSDVNDDDVLEEYNYGSAFNREDGKTTYTIAGTVKGLVINDPQSDPRAQKYASALNYFNSIVQPALLTRLNIIASGNISYSRPVSVDIDRNPTMGVINYNFKYTNEPPPCISGSLSEVISVTDQNKAGDVQVFAEIDIPGRVAGPVLQDIQTTKRKIRTLSVEIVMAPTGGCNFLTAYNSYPNVDSIVTALVPAGQVFKDDDSQSWSWRNGRFSRNVSWVYQ